MAERIEVPEQTLLRDPLSDMARRERRGLLGVSLIAIAVVQGHMMPARLLMAGVELTLDNQRFLLSLLFVVVLYFVVTFLLYTLSEYGLWGFDFNLAQQIRAERSLKALHKAIEPDPRAPITPDTPAEKREIRTWRRAASRRRWGARLTKWSFALRIFLDLILPPLIGGFALWLLWHAEPTLPPLASYPIWTLPR